MTTQDPALNLVVLCSVDVDACRTFYEDLGLIFAFERHGNRPERAASWFPPGNDSRSASNRTAPPS